MLTVTLSVEGIARGVNGAIRSDVRTVTRSVRLKDGA